MSEQRPSDPLDDRLREAGARFKYPPTPDIARTVRRRLAAEGARPAGRGLRRSRWAPVAAAIAFLLLALLAVPEVRAGIRAILRIGSVEIVLPTPTLRVPIPTGGPVPSATARSAQAASTAAPAPTPQPSATPMASLLDLAGETTLDDARRRVPFKLPSYPPDLGPPSRVFVQDFDGPVAILVWVVPGKPDQARLSLHALTSQAFAQKMAGENTLIKRTTVAGHEALWVHGPHLLQFYQHRSGYPEGRMVRGDVLIWTQDGLTYRLESEGDLTVEQAVKIAASLH
jgi:hypothetical protein